MEWSPGALILDVQGVGYQLFIPDGYDGSIVKLGGELSLFVHTHVREDAIQLYGFASREELSMFETLLGVSGVGPRLALAIVAHLRPEALARAVMEGEERALTKIPGVGKKTAARIVLELKDKVKEMAAPSAGTAAGERPAAGSPASPVDDAVAALVALGFSEGVASDAVRQAVGAAEAEDVEGLIKAALRRLDRVG